MAASAAVFILAARLAAAAFFGRPISLRRAASSLRAALVASRSILRYRATSEVPNGVSMAPPPFLPPVCRSTAACRQMRLISSTRSHARL